MKMKQVIKWAILFVSTGIMIYLFVLRQQGRRGSEIILPLLSLLVMLADYNEVRWKFSDIRHQKLRLASYGLTAVMLSLFALSDLEIIQMTKIVPGMTAAAIGVAVLAKLLVALLVLINIGYLIRDVDRKGRGVAI